MDNQDLQRSLLLPEQGETIDRSNHAKDQQALGMPMYTSKQHQRLNIGHPMFTNPFPSGLWPNVPPSRLPVEQFGPTVYWQAQGGMNRFPQYQQLPSILHTSLGWWSNDQPMPLLPLADPLQPQEVLPSQPIPPDFNVSEQFTHQHYFAPFVLQGNKMYGGQLQMPQPTRVQPSPSQSVVAASLTPFDPSFPLVSSQIPSQGAEEPSYATSYDVKTDVQTPPAIPALTTHSLRHQSALASQKHANKRTSKILKLTAPLLHEPKAKRTTNAQLTQITDRASSHSSLSSEQLVQISATSSHQFREHPSFRITSKRPFFCCHGIAQDDDPTRSSSTNKFNATILKQFVSWTCTATRNTLQQSPMAIASKRQLAWAPYVIELQEMNKSDTKEYYMPLPRTVATSIVTPQLQSSLSNVDYARVSAETFRDEFLGTIATTTRYIKCAQQNCPSASLGGAEFRIAVLPAQYSYEDNSVADSAKRNMIRQIRGSIGHAIFTQDLLLALDIHGGNVKLAVQWLLSMH